MASVDGRRDRIRLAAIVAMSVALHLGLFFLPWPSQPQRPASAATQVLRIEWIDAPLPQAPVAEARAAPKTPSRPAAVRQPTPKAKGSAAVFPSTDNRRSDASEAKASGSIESGSAVEARERPALNLALPRDFRPSQGLAAAAAEQAARSPESALARGMAAAVVRDCLRPDPERDPPVLGGLLAAPGLVIDAVRGKCR
jgi:hypothetical protein